VFTAFLPSTRGVHDDHLDRWSPPTAREPADTGEGLESVVGLGRSEEWLDPPKVPTRTELSRALAEF
jgi:hypothetical protein